MTHKITHLYFQFDFLTCLCKRHTQGPHKTMTYRSSTVNMVDCGNLRCFQERRLIKKELMTWSKKIPLVVGMYSFSYKCSVLPLRTVG